MPKITEKSIFEDRLKGKPICIHSGETTEQELQILIDAKVLRINREIHGEGIAIAMCEIQSGEEISRAYHDKFHILYKYFIVAPGNFVSY